MLSLDFIVESVVCKQRPYRSWRSIRVADGGATVSLLRRNRAGSTMDMGVATEGMPPVAEVPSLS